MPTEVRPAARALPTGNQTMSSALPRAACYHRYILDRVAPYLGQRIWEVGCGNGQYTPMLLENDREVLATDIDRELLQGVERQRLRFGRRLDVEYVDLCAEDTIRECGRWNPDTVLCLNVLEHIERDVDCLQWIRQAVRPTTQAVFLTPALPFLFGFMDDDAGHFRRYTRRSLARAFDSAGWRVGRAFYMNPVGGVGWFVQNRLLPRGDQHLDSPSVNASIEVFDRYCVPLTRLLDPLCARVFGQSVVVTAVPCD